MNLLFLTLLYHPARTTAVSQASKTGLQNQINNYQWAMVEGLRQSLPTDGQLDIRNALPVGVFPMHYRKPTLPTWQEPHFQELGSLNLPWLKQWARKRKFAKALLAWARQDESNRDVLVYTLYLPYMQAVARAKRRCPQLRATVIVTDLPNQWGISSGRKGLLKRLEYAMGRKRLSLCSAFDGFVLLTEQMSEVLPTQGKPTLVMEGIILPQAPQEKTAEATPAQGLPTQHPGKPVVLYTGTLNRELGIGELLAAFEAMPNCQLWLCGKGDMEAEAMAAARKTPTIQYFGFVEQGEALRLQGLADILINPRTPQGVFTRYSFPSKTLEYMRSGKPVLCYPLEGIPREYDEYLFYIVQEGPEGIQSAVTDMLQWPVEKRRALGARAREFVVAQKSAAPQSRRLLDFLYEVSAFGRLETK